MSEPAKSSKPPLPAYIPTIERVQAKPMIKMIARMLPKALKARTVGRGTRGKIVTGDVHITQKKIRYW